MITETFRQPTSTAIRVVTLLVVITSMSMLGSHTPLVSAVSVTDTDGFTVIVSEAQVDEDRYKVLVFSKTAAFRHASIPNGIAAIQSLGEENDFGVDTTEDAESFTDANLAQYDAVIFLNTTGDVLDEDQQAAFERHIQAGGGFVGIHSAADTEFGWSWYGSLLGAYYDSHPVTQPATINIEDNAHPSTSNLPEQWERTDEWYNYSSNPREDVHILATLDESSYSGGTQGEDHPIAWCHAYDGGRAWYTGGGHTSDSYSEPLFLAHILGGIEWATGAIGGDCGQGPPIVFQKVVLEDDIDQPMKMSIAPDGRVFFVEREGTLKIFKPNTNTTVTAAQFDVDSDFEDGLLGIVHDPNFESNQWVYIFYSPNGPTPKQHVSRFTMIGDTLDMDSEVVLLEIPTQRDECCHSSGSLQFDANGNLYISTGDNTNPFATGYSPLDEREGRTFFDSQRTSGNTNDLRGKILRITPELDGTYSIPDGNLFPEGQGGRPEIYLMGLRNPFRFSIDDETGRVYIGDVGPDATTPDSSRGPQGFDEINLADGPANFGWPYCVADNKPYIDYDFSTQISGNPFDCDSPTNDSPNNTGAQSLPPAQPALIWYPYQPSDEFPEMGSESFQGRTAMAGPVYHFDPDLESEVKLPAILDDSLFIYEWSRNWIMQVTLDLDGNIIEIKPFVPEMSFTRPIDMEIGPDGAMYVLEWGSGFTGSNPDSQLVRIDSIVGGLAPVARASAEPTSGPAPLQVSFSSEGSFDPDEGDSITYEWDFDGDDVVDSTDPNPTFTYVDAGNYTAQLVVTDTVGKTGVSNMAISAGNTAPVVTIETPLNGEFYNWGDAIPYKVVVTDAEDGSTADGSIDCDSVTVLPALGHDTHSHPLVQIDGCEGEIIALNDHADTDNLFYVIEAQYVDNGAPGVLPLEGNAQLILQPKRKQAEHFSTNNGVMVETTGDVEGGVQNIGFIAHGDYVSFQTMNLKGIHSLNYRAASRLLGGRIEVHVDSPDGELISTADIPPTGDWQLYTNVFTTIADPGGAHELFFVFLNNPGNDGLFNINWIDFQSHKISIDMTPVSQSVSRNSDAVFYVEVANRGDVPLVNVEVTNDAAQDCDQAIGDLAVGETFGYDCAVSSVSEDFTNTATTTGTPPVGSDVTDNASAAVELVGMCGDIDGDGVIDSVDAAAYLQTIANNSAPDASLITVADLDNDGRITILDTVALMKHIVNGLAILDRCPA